MTKHANVQKTVVALTLGFLLAGVLTAPAEPASPGSPLRLAIVADPDCADLAALVTTELSGDAALHLLEREELAKAGDEARLQQLVRQNSVTLGRLVGADGLLFLHKTGADVRVRLTAVALGDALYDGQIAPGNDPAVAAQTIARLVSGYAPKLRLDPAKAVPISVLNVRAESATTESTTLERRLTLLLESRLAAVPEYVVLERRHAGALGFERSLNPDARPLLQGSYLVDGSFSLPLAGRGDMTVRLRMVSSEDGPQTLEVRGDANDLPGLVEKLTAAIRQATGRASDPGVWQPENEAHEYLLEALWAWQHHVRDAAWEAADSAGLLGERSADLAALRVNLLLDRAGDGIVHPGGLPTGRHPMEGRPLDVCTDDLLQGIAEATRYSDDGLEKKIALSDPRQNLDVRAYEMKKTSIRLGTELIARLDEAGSPRADEVRRALRPFTGYDPLHGKPGTHSPASPWLQPAIYTDRWALTLEEALAWLRLSCTVPDGYVEPRLITGQGKGFCQRFLKTPEAQEAAFREFVSTLRDDPAARLAALVIETGAPDPAAADAACRMYLDALWPLREALSANQPHRREWTDLGEIPEPVRRRQAGAMVPLLRFYLTHAMSFEFGTFCIRPMWLPSEWSAADATAVWIDYQDCKLRMEQDRQKRGRNLSWLNSQEAGLEDPLLKKFPALATVGKVPDSGLAVTRYWHPWRVPDSPPGRFSIVDAAAAEGGLFVLGYFRGENGLRARLYRISSAGFETEVITPPTDHINARRLEVTPEAIDVDYYLMGDVPRAEARRTGRFDRHSRTWTTSIVTPPDAEYQHIGGETFVHLPDALARLDPVTGQMDLLISDRRKPPRNPLDSVQHAGAARVFAGPGSHPCVASQAGVFYLQAEPGDWRQVCDIGEWPSSVTRGGQTVLATWDGEAVLIDPARSEPEYLMAPAGGFYWGRYTDGPKTSAKMPWRQQTPWDPPGKGQGSVEMNAERIAWRDERFFVLSQPPGKSQRYELFAYTKKGGRKPTRVPLEFRLDEAARQSLAPIYTGDQSSDGSIESIEHPGYGLSALKPIADERGLWLYSAAGSVWFVPYADLDEYIKNHAADLE